MPYCSNCGSEIDEGNKYCNKCGSPIGGQIITINSPLGQQEITRRETLNELDRMIKFFGRKEKKYDEYDACSEMIAYLNDPKARVKVNMIWGRPFKIWGIILMSCSFPIALVFASEFGSPGNPVYQNAIPFFIIFLIAGLILLIVGIIKNGIYESEQIKQKDLLLRQNQDRIVELSTELMKHYNAYGYCAVSSAYTNPKILSAIRDMVYSGRADTIKEAINVMIQDEHYSEMELQATLNAQSSALTAQYAASAARGAKVAAFFSAANFVHSIRKKA